MTHGLNARVATYFPAKPGRYEACAGCVYLADASCWEAVACQRQTELFLRHQIAFETGDPKLLLDLRSDLHAAVWAIINNIILAITTTGVELKNPEWYFDPKGEQFHIVKFTQDGVERISYKVQAHPLLRTLTDFLSKNNLSLADLGMTPRVQDEHDAIRGHLQQEKTDRETDQQFRADMKRQTDVLLQLLNTSSMPSADEGVIESEVVDG